jgi:abortive infection bacteriophage resistance protein
LRLLTLDAIERVEVAIRSQLAYHLAHFIGPFGYVKPANLPKLDSDQFGKFLTRVYDETKKSPEEFVEHFHNKYGDKHSYMPIWMAIEIMPFGMFYTLFKGVAPTLKQTLASPYDVTDTVLSSWLGALNSVRNICAHHGRLWNRQLGFRPMIPNNRKYPQWRSPVAIPSDRVFGVLTILRYLLVKIAPQSKWRERLFTLLAEYPDIPRGPIGFPPDWEKCPIWQENYEKH